jgi:hypothetical protein
MPPSEPLLLSYLCFAPSSRPIRTGCCRNGNSFRVVLAIEGTPRGELQPSLGDSDEEIIHHGGHGELMVKHLQAAGHVTGMVGGSTKQESTRCCRYERQQNLT